MREPMFFHLLVEFRLLQNIAAISIQSSKSRLHAAELLNRKAFEVSQDLGTLGVQLVDRNHATLVTVERLPQNLRIYVQVQTMARFDELWFLQHHRTIYAQAAPPSAHKVPELCLQGPPELLHFCPCGDGVRQLPAAVLVRPLPGLLPLYIPLVLHLYPLEALPQVLAEDVRFGKREEGGKQELFGAAAPALRGQELPESVNV
mmetsp:Transcript_86625/g.279709  ORF Transcript_86625/g.279709 Transcript_86625/m.279709 type:complete len:203 (+) Transcript_86625:1721-2329(+)